jgi:hypothetical protein
MQRRLDVKRVLPVELATAEHPARSESRVDCPHVTREANRGVREPCVQVLIDVLYAKVVRSNLIRNTRDPNEEGDDHAADHRTQNGRHVVNRAPSIGRPKQNPKAAMCCADTPRLWRYRRRLPGSG